MQLDLLTELGVRSASYTLATVPRGHWQESFSPDQVTELQKDCQRASLLLLEREQARPTTQNLVVLLW